MSLSKTYSYTTEEVPCTGCNSVGVRYPMRKSSGRCYKCVTAQQRAWHSANSLRSSRNQSLKNVRKYGLSEEEFDTLLVKQRGLCPICHCQLQPPCIEHCHDTGKVRGITCRQCNTAMGQADDNPTRLRRMSLYLEGHL